MKKYPNKEIQKDIEYALSKSWQLIETGKSSHAWGRLLCKQKSRQGCQISIWSTPRNSSSHAKHIYRAVNKCPH